MTAQDDRPGNGKESIDASDWEVVARERIGCALRERGHDLRDVSVRVAGQIEAGEGPTPEQLEELRSAVRAYELLIEETVAEVTPEAEQSAVTAVTRPITWEKMAEALGVSLEDVNDLRRSQ